MGIFKKYFENLYLGLKLNLVFVLALGVLLAALIVVTRTSLENFAAQTGRQRVEQEVEVIKSRFAEAENELLASTKALANTPGLVEAVAGGEDEKAKVTLLIGLARFELADAVVVGTNSEIFSGAAVVPEDESLVVRQGEALLRLALIGTETSGLIDVGEDPQPRLRLAAAVHLRDSAGQIVGALITSRELDDEFLRKINLGRRDILLVLIGEEQILGHTFSDHGEEGEAELIEMSDVLLDERVIRQALKGQTVIAEDIIFSEDGSPHMVAHMPLAVGRDRRVVIGILAELRELFIFQRQLISNLSTLFVLLALTVMVVVVIVTQSAARNISISINKLRSVAEQMESGDYGQRAEVTSADEVGHLARAFNTMVAQLQGLIGSLEEQVAARTKRLEINAALSERLTAILDFDQLLDELVNQVKDSFGYYHAHIYLLDDQREKLIVAEGTGAAGAEMKAKGHNIPLASVKSLVARAARSGEIITVNNVRQAEDWLPNPLLPDTFSEMAVPIILEGRVFGVLDVQEDTTGGLDEGDAALLRSLANQVAVAIRNARLFAEVNAALNEAHAVQAQYAGRSWQKARIAPQGEQYCYLGPGAAPLTRAKQRTMATAKEQALAQDRPTIVPLNDLDGGEAKTKDVVVAPVIVRNTKIGALHLHPRGDARPWQEDDLAMIRRVVNRLAQAAENLRLFEETRERAAYEQSTREITEKLRAAPSLNALLETAARELGQRLEVEHTVVEMGIEPNGHTSDE